MSGAFTPEERDAIGAAFDRAFPAPTGDTVRIEADYSTGRARVAPQRFRKRPVEIEAMQWNGGLTSNHAAPAVNASTLIDWVLACGGTARFVNQGEDHPLRYADELYRHSVVKGDRAVARDAPAFIVIETLEGPHRTNPLDYVIRGVQGEFYPCKPEIFAETYAEVREATAEGLQRSERRSLFAPRVHALADAILHSPRAADPGRVQYRPAGGGLVLAELTIAASLTDDELPTSGCAPVRPPAPMVSMQTYAGDEPKLTAMAAVQVRVIPEGEPYEGPLLGTVTVVAPPEHVDEARRVISEALRIGELG